MIRFLQWIEKQLETESELFMCLPDYKDYEINVLKQHFDVEKEPFGYYTIRSKHA